MGLEENLHQRKFRWPGVGRGDSTMAAQKDFSAQGSKVQGSVPNTTVSQVKLCSGKNENMTKKIKLFQQIRRHREGWGEQNSRLNESLGSSGFKGAK